MSVDRKINKVINKPFMTVGEGGGGKDHYIVSKLVLNWEIIDNENSPKEKKMRFRMTNSISLSRREIKLCNFCFVKYPRGGNGGR